MKDAATKVCKILQDHGHQAVFAGGCVRDMLLKKEPHDIDIATSATPKEVVEIFKKTVPIGISFGVVQVHMDGFQFEVATFRTESKSSDGRRPDSIKFSSMEEDAKRRDFTVNALFYDPIKDEIYDFVDGKNDIYTRTLRFVGNPKERLEEDQLRALRAIRFSSNDFKLDKDTSLALLSADISKLSKERIKSELDKILLLKNCSEAFERLMGFGLLEQIIPEMKDLLTAYHEIRWHPEGHPWRHTLIVLDLARSRTDNLNILWGALLHDIGKPATEKVIDGKYTNHGHAEVGEEIAEKILRNLRAPNCQIDEVKFLVKNHMRIKNASKMKKSKIARLKAEKFYEDLRLLSICDSQATGIPENLNWVKHLDKVEEYKELPKPFLNGYDLKDIGVLPGSWMGYLLDKLMDLQLEGKIRDREDALVEAKRIIKEDKNADHTYFSNMIQMGMNPGFMKRKYEN